MHIRLLTVAAAVAAVTACAASPAQATSPNVLACRHFKAQGDKFNAIASPGLADIAQAVTWVQEDAGLATDPALRRDFRHWVADTDKLMNGQTPGDNPKAPIVAACARFGVRAS